MKKFVIAVTLMAMIGFAAVAQADLTRAGAMVRAIELAKWKAACEQGYWHCTTYFVEACVSSASGVDTPPQWDCSVHVVRRHDKNVQWCQVELGLHHKTAETLYLTIKCGAPPPAARDSGTAVTQPLRYG